MTAAIRPAGGLYFGWRIVAAQFLCIASLLGVAIYSFIIFSTPLAQQFHWNSAQTGTLVSAMWVAAPLALGMAPLIDRLGAWRLVVTGMLIEVVALLIVGFVTAFWQFYLLRIAMGVGKIFVMTASPVVVARWFERRFATAMAITWSGGAAGGIIMAPLTERLADAAGWRTTSLFLSGGLAATLIIAALLVRGSAAPRMLEQRCLEGFVTGTAAPSTRPPSATKGNWLGTIRQMNWRVTIIMCLSVMGAGLVAIALQTFEPPLLRAAGLPASTAAAMLGLTASAALLGSASGGWLLDRFPQRWTASAAALAMGGGLLGLWIVSYSGGTMLAACAAFTAGYALGTTDVIWIDLFKRQFGITAFPVTYGIFYFSLQLGFATGGYAGGLSFDKFGSAGFIITMACIYAPAVVFTFWRPYRCSMISPASAVSPQPSGTP